MMSNKEDPMILVKKAQAGDTESFGKLYEDFFTPIFRFILPKVSDKETAEDLTQVVFIKLFESLPSFKQSDANPLSYLFTIARNTVFDFYKKKRDVIIGENQVENIENNIFHKIEDDNPIPCEMFEISEKQRLVIAEINKLNKEQREVIFMKFMEGRKNFEIAEILGRTEDSIRQLQCRALKKLRAQFYKREII